ncbi:MAG: hypothetical protein AAB347_09335 [Bacteroidota bacterium]
MLPKLILSALILSGCNSAITATKEYSCAPQNISFQFGSLRCVYAGAVSSHPEPLKIFCKEGSYKEDSGEHSCIDEQNVKHVIKPITLSREELFSKKQDCQKYIPDIQRRLDQEEDNSVLALTIFYNLENVFYSVSMNSCLYVSTERMSFDNDTNFITYVVSDALTGQLLMNTSEKVTPENVTNTGEQFKIYLKEYE